MARTFPAKSAYVDGIRYLLAVMPTFPDHVARYSVGEMAEIFTVDQLHALDRGETVDHRGTRYTDMVLAARAELVA